MKNEIAISIEHISKKFSNGTLALDDISFSVNRGEFTVIAGANGSGKTVLMSLIAGLDFPTSGTIKTLGKAGLVFQDADAQILGESVIEDVMFAPKNLGCTKTEAQKIAMHVLAECGLEEKAESSARFLSGGEKRRLAVSGVLAMKSDIIIFDEPFANLDWTGVCQVTNILQKLKNDKTKTVIVLTHEIEKCLALAEKFLVLYKTKICFDGKPEVALEKNLENWGIKNPLTQYKTIEDLLWKTK